MALDFVANFAQLVAQSPNMENVGFPKTSFQTGEKPLEGMCALLVCLFHQNIIYRAREVDGSLSLLSCVWAGCACFTLALLQETESRHRSKRSSWDLTLALDFVNPFGSISKP